MRKPLVPCAASKVMIDPYQEAVEAERNPGILEGSIGH